jgi:PAS domain S-box-containing protein
LPGTFFFPPQFSFTVSDPTAPTQLIIFMLAGVLISLLAESLHRSRRRTEESEAKEREQRERLRVTLESIGDAVIATNAKGQVTFMNHVAETLTAWKQDEATNKPLQEVFHILNEQTREEVENPALRAMREGVIIGLANHSVLVAKDGAEIPIDDSGAPIQDSGRTIMGSVLIFRDITEPRRAEKERALLADIVMSSEDAIISKSRNGIIEAWNAGAERIFGYQAAEAIGQPITIIVPPERIEEEQSILERLSRGERIEHFETVRLAKNSNTVDISVTVSPVRDAAGRIIGASKIARDITQRKRTEEALAHQSEWLRVTLASIGDAVIATDINGVVTFMNSVAESLTGWKQEEAAGQPLQEVFNIVNEETRQTVENPAVRAIREGLIVGLANHTVLISKTGTEIAIDDSGAPIKDANEKTIGAVLVFRDITDRKQAELERIRLLEREHTARTQAEAASRAKDEFLATVSHELRTPLTAILGWARLLTLGDLQGETGRRAIETIERNAKSQAQLIEDLLDMSRIISGKLGLKFEPVSLVHIIESALESVRPTVQAKSIEMTAKLDSAAGVVIGDATRLQQVVWNLLSNAVKFTPAGGRVEVKLEHDDAHAQIIISDNGKGISPEFLPHLFERFQQADSKDTRQQGGLGLGLAIVQQLVEMHDGTVKAESPGEGQGATFIVRLPAAAIRQETAVLREELETERRLAIDKLSRLDGVKVLVVDDEASSRDVIAAVLGECGATVTAVSSAAEGLLELERMLPDVLISDIGMPDENGYELIRKVRMLRAEQGGNIPAIALTAYAKAEDRMRALAAGFQTHVPKPVEPAELALVVARLVERGRIQEMTRLKERS